MKNSYPTLSEAITDFKNAGFTVDLNLCELGIENKKIRKIHSAKDFNVIKFYRFAGMSDPDDNMVLNVIETSAGDKSLLVDAYGAY